MDRFERVRELRDDYESALDEAEKRRADYHREIVKLHRSGMSLREIAEGLGISHQRVHQIVGVAEERSPSRRRLIGGVAGAIVVTVVAASVYAATRGSGGDHPIATSIPSTVQPSLSHGIPRTIADVAGVCSIKFARSKSSFSPITMAAAAQCSPGTAVAIDPDTGKVLAIVRVAHHGRWLRLTYPA